MTPTAASSRPWALWTTLLAMLLAVQASAGAIRPAALADSGLIAAKLTLPAPLAAQLRESGQALKAAGQRLTARPPDGHDGATPPLPVRALAFAAPTDANELLQADRPSARHGESGASAYCARAPPRVA
ncbi:hypothetical protein [Sphingomonas sp.]|uniref:hypothetical protein n=1 Tax=Sphingomonas sp. TaxID=28214 RepID=UPI0031D178AB